MNILCYSFEFYCKAKIYICIYIFYLYIYFYIYRSPSTFYATQTHRETKEIIMRQIHNIGMLETLGTKFGLIQLASSIPLCAWKRLESQPPSVVFCLDGMLSVSVCLLSNPGKPARDISAFQSILGNYPRSQIICTEFGRTLGSLSTAEQEMRV